MSVSGILVLGRPSTGKSTSLRNLDPESTIIFTPNAKPLPFPGSSAMYKEGENRFITSSLTQLKTLLEKLPEQRPNAKTVIVEDFSHYFSARTMSSAFANAGDKWGRWGVYAADIYAIIKQATEDLRKLEAVVLIHHTLVDDAGVETFASSGNLVDREIKPISYFTYVLHSAIIEKDETREYVFQTNFANNKEAKTPMGLFEELHVPNDMVEVIKKIKIYENEDSKIDSMAEQGVTA